VATAGGVVIAAGVLAAMLGDGDSLRATKIVAVGVIALSLVPLVGFGGQVSLFYVERFVEGVIRR